MPRLIVTDGRETLTEIDRERIPEVGDNLWLILGESTMAVYVVDVSPVNASDQLAFKVHVAPND